MASPPLTVLMSVYNGEKYLATALDSVLTQTYGDFDFVIVDDGSTDSTAAILKEFAAKDARIRVFGQTNAGLAASLNLGLQQTASEYVARMDADDLALPHRFATQVAALNSETRLAVIGSRVLCIDENGRTRHRRPVVTGSAAIAATLPFANCINHPSTMMRTVAVVEAGGYRRKFKVSQDYDLWLRLSERHQLDNLPEVLLHYRTYEGATSTARNRARLTPYSVCAAVDFFCRKHRLATSEDPIDVDNPVSVTSALSALLARDDLTDAERKALHRHAQRLLRNSHAGPAITDFAAFVRRDLARRHEYLELAKLAIYRLSRRRSPTKRG
ncbi:MAG: glycosyltransferase [Bauldia sp.]